MYCLIDLIWLIHSFWPFSWGYWQLEKYGICLNFSSTFGWTVPASECIWTFLCFRPGWVFKWDTHVQQQRRLSQHHGLISLHMQGWIFWRWILLLWSHIKLHYSIIFDFKMTYECIPCLWAVFVCDHCCRHRWVCREQQPVWERQLSEPARRLQLWLWHGLHHHSWWQGLRG